MLRPDSGQSQRFIMLPSIPKKAGKNKKKKGKLSTVSFTLFSLFFFFFCFCFLRYFLNKMACLDGTLKIFPNKCLPLDVETGLPYVFLLFISVFLLSPYLIRRIVCVHVCVILCNNNHLYIDLYVILVISVFSILSSFHCKILFSCRSSICFQPPTNPPTQFRFLLFCWSPYKKN